MTSSSNAALMAGDDFDSGPLSWVMVEIGDTLRRSGVALSDALAEESDADARGGLLRQARAHLHQAHGALQIVDVDGVTMVTETIEDLYERIDTGECALTPAVAQAIGQAGLALIEYLEELLAGAVQQPVRLFPYYQALLQARGAERIHPADLFFPNLAIRPVLPALDAPVTALDYGVLRKRFEKALLPFLKGSGGDPGTEQMYQIISEIELAQGNQQSRGFWWVMHGFAEAVAAGEVIADVAVKQLFARINLQIRRMSEGSTSIAEGLLRDALFFIARVVQPSPRLQQIRSIYRLDGQVPADFAEKRYGRVDAVALATARERLTKAKTLWSRVADGDDRLATAFEQEMRGLADAGAGLNAPPLAKLLRELNGIARAAANASAGDRLGLEMATSLLFVEQALGQIGYLPENFTERADAMTARLVSIVAGEQVAVTTPWFDDMSRQAQQRQTSVALTNELQSSLRQVEKMLEAYFINPVDPAPLAPVDLILHQIGGALAVLDHDDAARAVTHTQNMLRTFAAGPAPDPVVALPQFQQIARNLGALGFFVETLQAQRDSQRKRFSFDDKTGIFAAGTVARGGVLLVDVEELDQPQAPPSVAQTEAVPVSLSTVEEDLRAHQQAAATLAQLLVADIASADLHAQLKQVLQQVRRDASLIDHPEANEQARAAMMVLDRPDFARMPGAAVDLMVALALVVPASVADPAAVMAPDTDAAIDAELLDIFLSEAVDVLAAVRDTLPALHREPTSQEHLTTLRRAFHTLKGSGRMVGLNTFGAAAWSIEQVLNLRLAETRGGDPDLYALVDMALATLGGWVDDLQGCGRSDCSPAPLVAAAQRLLDGLPLVEVMPEATGTGLLPVDADAVPAAADSTAIDVSEIIDAETEAAEIEIAEIDFAQIVAAISETAAASGSVIGFPTLQAPLVQRNDNVKQIGSIEISVALHNIYLAEADALVRLLSTDIDEWRHEPERDVNVLAMHAAHSLAGTSATVGFKPLQEIAHALESVLQQLARTPVRLLGSEFDTLAQVVERIRFMLQLFALSEMAEPEPWQVEFLEQLQQAISARAEAGAPATPAEPDFASLLSKESATFDRAPADAVLATETDAAPLVQQPQDLMPTEPAQVPVIDAAMASAFPLADYGMAPELEQQQAVTTPVQDDLDPDLMPVFTEEALDMLPQMGQLLRQWQQTPTDAAAPQALLRVLHTIKGSARMAGAMRLGQHMHEMESRVEQIMQGRQQSPQAMEDLLARHDLGLQMFESLLNPPSPVVSTEAPVLPATVADVPEVTEVVPAEAGSLLAGGLPDRRRAPRAAPDAGMVTTAVSVPLVRVRADILDRLVNQAGEVSIARSRLENDVETMRQSLAELTDNVARLREQLREVEMQAESQIENQTNPQRSNSGGRQFDPLEFDRFTRLQELTRMMAESVNDVGSVQQNLMRTLEHASEDLGAQARLTRDLQQDLMRVRMVQFASITERLYRVTRQASKEVDKRVSLDIRGGAVEIDRSVLEKMAGPFEHLLRNAIVHGIETREQRRTAGKNEVGELLVEVRQEGNEVAIQFSDDGGGLDLVRIRDKATATGLLGADATPSDTELGDLIFHPGFSTAAAVTELAGRGVGMDVVRAEAASLGGRVVIQSLPGKGAQFTVHLPLTLAVTQVVLLTTGGKTYAVPSVLVEQVQQLKPQALAAAYNEGAVLWQNQRVPMVYLASLLGEAGTSAVAQQYSPLLILKSGSSRIAIHVDEILGNREVVVKNVGPQLARLTGVAGATVLGSGEIVLILNPLALAQRAAQENIRAPRLDPSEAGPYLLGAVAEFDHAGDSSATPVAGLQTQRIVMVVDDSLTVRRVTQRLLSREGYQVVLAKDGIDALEQLQSITPDVMLVDIEMPRMDGFDLTRNVRDGERTRHVPIIMITSRTAAKHRDYAFELGVNDYMGKPFQEDLLLKLVAEYAGRDAPVA